MAFLFFILRVPALPVHACQQHTLKSLSFLTSHICLTSPHTTHSPVNDWWLTHTPHFPYSYFLMVDMAAIMASAIIYHNGGSGLTSSGPSLHTYKVVEWGRTGWGGHFGYGGIVCPFWEAEKEWAGQAGTGSGMKKPFFLPACNIPSLSLPVAAWCGVVLYCPYHSLSIIPSLCLYLLLTTSLSPLYWTDWWDRSGWCSTKRHLLQHHDKQRAPRCARQKGFLRVSLFSVFYSAYACYVLWRIDMYAL